jgi:hypothetical protein
MVELFLTTRLVEPFPSHCETEKQTLLPTSFSPEITSQILADEISVVSALHQIIAL